MSSLTLGLGWPQDKVLEFIELYKSENILWDRSHPMHKDKVLKLEAWKRIQDAFSIDCSLSDLKRKKESIMAVFRNQCKKIKKNPQMRGSWFAYSTLKSFLGHLYDLDDIDSFDEVNHEEEIYIPAPKREKNEDHQYFNITEAPSVKKKMKKEHNNSNLIYISPYKDGRSSLGQEYNEESEMDECELYGRLLVKKLRKLNEEQRDIAMHEIDNIIFKAKMQSLDQQKSKSSLTNRSNSPVFIIAQGNQLDNDGETIEVYQQNPLPDQTE